MANKGFNRYSTKRVTYIFVTKNRPSMFKKSLEKAKKLKTNLDELIVVDGSSNDHTLKIIKRNRRLINKYVFESDDSPAHAVNKAILISSGKYVKYLTDDDVVYPNAINKAIEVLDKEPSIDLLLCGGTRYRVSKRKWQVVYNPPGTNFGKHVDDVFRYGTNAMGYIIRRESYAKFGLVPIGLLADQLFLINYIKGNADVRFCRIKLYHQNIHDNTINSKQRKELAKLLFRAARTHASKPFFVRFAFNWFLNDHFYIKILFVPFGIFLSVYKRLLSYSIDNKDRRKHKAIWDAGFS